MAIVEFRGGPITHRYLMNKSKSELAHMVLHSWKTASSSAAKIREVGDRIRVVAASSADALEVVANDLGGPRPEAEPLIFCSGKPASTVYATREVVDAWVAYIARALPLYDVARVTRADGGFGVTVSDPTSNLVWWIFDGKAVRFEPPSPPAEPPK